MHPIVNQGFAMNPNMLGTYSSPVSACFNGTIKPSKRVGVIINPNEAVETCLHKARLYSKLQQLEVPTPTWKAGIEMNPPTGFEFLAYDRQFENKTAVLLHPQGRVTIRSYTDLVQTLKAGYSWEKAVMFEQNDDYCFSFELVATRVKGVQYETKRHEHVLSVDYGQYEPDSATLIASQTVASEIVTKLEADFVRIKFEWSPNGFYVTDVTTMVTEETVEQVKAVIRRKVAMRR